MSSVRPLTREKLRQVIRGGGLAGITGAMLPAYLLRRRIGSESERRAARDAWVRAYARSLLRVFQVEVVRRSGPMPAPYATAAAPATAATAADGKPRGRLIVANHRSALDILVLLSEFGGRMVARHDIATWPLLGKAAGVAETIFVNRTDSTSGMLAVRAIGTALKRGDTVTVFPEGTTFTGDEVRPFHAGSFVATAGVDCDIVPVGLAYPVGSGAEYFEETFGAHLLRVGGLAKPRMALCVGAPISTNKRRARDIEREAFGAVQSLVHDARRLLA